MSDSGMNAKDSGNTHTFNTPFATIRFSGGVSDSGDSDSDADEFLINSGLPRFCPKNNPAVSDSISHPNNNSEDPRSSKQNDPDSESDDNKAVCDDISQVPKKTNTQSQEASNSMESPENSHLDEEKKSTDNNNVASTTSAGDIPNLQNGSSGRACPSQNEISLASAVINTEEVNFLGKEEPRLDSQDLKKDQLRIRKSPERFNPFNRLSKEEMQEGLDFSCSPDESADFRTATEHSNASTDSWSEVMPRSRSGSPEEQDINAELGLAEDHFGRPEGYFGLSTIEELDMAIQNCKVLIFKSPEHSERRKNLVNKLVQLRMRLLEAKEGPEVLEDNVKQVVGHRFKKKYSSSSKHYCEQCCAVIWGVVQNWYRCTGCSYTCHEKCLNSITRTCASVKVAENPVYILSICPEKGLAAQNYRCVECRAPISYKSGYGEPRQCDYTGSYYCERCHWNDVMVIPARVLHNYDLEQKKVCRASKQFLRLMTHRPVLRIQDVNPMLFNFVEELNEVKKLREELLIMKKYFLSCQAALESKLLLQLKDRQHFVENSDMYSLQDLVDVAMDTLLPQLAKIHASFAQHIKTDCQLCQAKGYICELCDQQEVLFPFDNIAIVCSQCSTVLHRHCFIRRNQRCPKCERRQRSVSDESVSSS